MTDSILVMIVEDDSDFAYLIQKAISGQPDMELIGVCADKEQALKMAQQNHPDIVLMDFNLSSAYMGGIEAAREIRLSTNAKIIILTAYENPEIVIEASKKSFASGYLFKSQFDFLVETVRQTARGHTPQEMMIFLWFFMTSLLRNALYYITYSDMTISCYLHKRRFLTKKQ